MHLKQYATNVYYTHTWQQTKIYLSVTRIRSWHSSVNVVTKLLIGWLRNHGLIPGRGKRTVSSLKRKDWDWGPPATYSMGTEVLSTMGGICWLTPPSTKRCVQQCFPYPHMPSWYGQGKPYFYHKNPTAIMFMKNTYYPVW